MTPKTKFAITLCVLIVAGIALLSVGVVCLTNQPHDLTYVETKDFLSQNNIDKRIYNVENYNCHNFATDLINDAKAEYIRCAYVRIHFIDNAHSIVAFNTTDNGLVFIEPQNDARARVVIGENYVAWGENWEIYCSDTPVVGVDITWT